MIIAKTPGYDRGIWLLSTWAKIITGIPIILLAYLGIPG